MNPSIKMNSVIILIPLLILLFVNRVKSENPDKIKCKTIVSLIVSGNVAELNSVLKDFLSTTIPKPKSDDQTGHFENLQLLVKKLGECNKISSSIKCYACIETYPLQSEVTLVIDSLGVEVSRKVDIVTPENGVLSIARIHY